MKLKEYTKQIEKEKLRLQSEILSKVEEFEELTGLSINEIKTVKLYGASDQKSRVIQVIIEAGA